MFLTLRTFSSFLALYFMCVCVCVCVCVSSSSLFFFFNCIYLFGCGGSYLQLIGSLILVVAHGIFDLSCGMCDLVP